MIVDGFDLNEHIQKANNKMPMDGVSPSVYISYLFRDFNKSVVEKLEEGVDYVTEKIEDWC